MNDYITKPVKIEQLSQVLSRCQPLSNVKLLARLPENGHGL
jgi:hypothetical protein